MSDIKTSYPKMIVCLSYIADVVFVLVPVDTDLEEPFKGRCVETGETLSFPMPWAIDKEVYSFEDYLDIMSPPLIFDITSKEYFDTEITQDSVGGHCRRRHGPRYLRAFEKHLDSL